MCFIFLFLYFLYIMTSNFNIILGKSLQKLLIYSEWWPTTLRRTYPLQRHCTSFWSRLIRSICYSVYVFVSPSTSLIKTNLDFIHMSDMEICHKTFISLSCLWVSFTIFLLEGRFIEGALEKEIFELFEISKVKLVTSILSYRLF